MINVNIILPLYQTGTGLPKSWGAVKQDGYFCKKTDVFF